jgi:hypothetical protein
MAEHTPGPWTVFDKNGVLAIVVGGGLHNEVIHWSGFDSSDFPKARRANAKLIAAAPDMKAALEAARTLLQAIVMPAGYETIAVAIAQIDTALRKANGQ